MIMDDIGRRYYRFLIVFMLVLCLVSIVLSLFAVRASEKVHATQTYEQILALKKQFLKDTVHNMTRDIDGLRRTNHRISESEQRSFEGELRALYRLDPEAFGRAALKRLKEMEGSHLLCVAIFRAGTDVPLYAFGGEAYATELEFGPWKVRLGANEALIDERTKLMVASLIHYQTFVNDGYLWVNEVLNWEGGDNYAIRRIHPNLMKTEGSYLSTKTTDIKGNTPYLTELEGIKRDGELFNRYYFKRKGSDEIAEKLTYATLYRDYNWIVAMGMHLEDLQVYIDSVEDSSDTLTRGIVLKVSALMLAFFTVALIILVRMERIMFRLASAHIRKESNKDHLTGALNRRIGDSYIGDAFSLFLRGKVDPAIFSMDLDDFKKVNDLWGHEAGDIVLKAVVARIRQTMRASDYLFRWGGEEFLLVYNDISRESAWILAERLNRVIETMDIPIPRQDGEVSLRITLSIGVSWFDKRDDGPGEALRRADEAMYRAKKEGKNCFRFADDPIVG